MPSHRPSKVELDAALRTMVDEVNRATAEARVDTESADVALRFSLETETDGSVRPIVHLGNEPPPGEVHTLRVSLSPGRPARRHDRSAEVSGREGIDEPVTEVDAPDAPEPVEQVAPADPVQPPQPPLRMVPLPVPGKKAVRPSGEHPEARAQASSVQGREGGSPKIRVAVKPKLKLQKARFEAGQKGASKPEKSQAKGKAPAYRSEVAVTSAQGPVVEERRAKPAPPPPPVAVASSGKKDKAAAKPEGGKPAEFVVFDRQSSGTRDRDISSLDTAEYTDEALMEKTEISEVPPESD